MALIGGRVTPSFTRNWLVKHGHQRLPAPFGAFDKAALLTAAAGSGALERRAGTCGERRPARRGRPSLAVRLLRWQGWSTWREPIVLVLHLGYLWLAAAFLMLGCSILEPEVMPQSAALHALTAGAVGTMTLAVMTRATLGHTGHAIETDRVTLAIYLAVSAGALLRVAAPLAPDMYLGLLSGGTLWSLAFGLFALRYGPLLLRPRRHSREAL